MNVTASRLGQALHCPASVVLPQVHTTSEWSTQGSAVAAFKFRAREVGREQALLEIPEDAAHRDFCLALPLDQLPQGARYELAVAYNVDDDCTVVLGEGLNRSYRAAARDAGIDADDHAWFFGTLDDAGKRNGRAFVGDEKTGRWCGNPETAEQLLFGSLAMSRHLGTDEAEQVFYYLDDKGQVRPDGAIVEDFKHLIPFAEKLRALPARIEAARAQLRLGVIPDVNPGPWCRHCKAALNCPAKATAVVKAMAEIPALKEQLGALEPVKLGELYARITDALPLLEAARGHIKEMATTAPIPLPDGQELREVEVRNKTKVIGLVAERVLQRRGYEPQIIEKAVKYEPTATKKSITDSLREVAPPGKLTAITEDVFQEIRVEGGLLEGTHLEVKAVKAGR